MLDERERPAGDGGATTESRRTMATCRFRLTFLSQIELPDEPEDLIRGLLPGRSFVVLYGRPGSGKSFVALDMALHVAAGRPWAGRRVRPAGVVYVASEGGRGLNRRVIAAMRHHGFESSLPFAVVTVAPNLGHRDDDADLLAKEIKNQLPSGFDCGLVILDTLARSMTGGDESGAAGMGIFIENTERLGKALHATVMAVHHMGKDPGAGMRGSSALLGAVDAAWEVDPEVKGLLKLAKMKDDDGDVHLTFTLTKIALGQFADGEPMTSCAVTLGQTFPSPSGESVSPPPETAAPAALAGLPGTAGAFLDALRALIDAAGQGASTRYKVIPKRARVILQAQLRVHAAALGIVGSSDKSCRTQIDRQILALVDRGLVCRHDGWIWLSENEVFTTNQEILATE